MGVARDEQPRRERAVRARSAPATVDAALADEHLPGWHDADAYESAVGPGGPDSAMAAARRMFAPSRRARALLGARDAAVRVVGLEPAVGAGELLFPVTHAGPGLIVLGLDDRHLDFRVMVQVAEGRVRCTTAVRYRGRLGRPYFAVVGPFHRRLVPRLLDRCATGTAGRRRPDAG